MKITIKTAIFSIITIDSVPDFPKYTSQLMNWANQNAQGTRPRVVGQLSELFPQYRKECGDGEEISIGGWERWYSERYPDSIDEAADKIFHQMEHLKEAIQLIDLDMIRRWVYDLVITKTYNGLYIQKGHSGQTGRKKKGQTTVWPARRKNLRESTDMCERRLILSSRILIVRKIFCPKRSARR